MNYEKFLELLGEKFNNYCYNDEISFKDNKIIYSCKYKGASGGNCWGDTAEDYEINIDYDDVFDQINQAFFKELNLSTKYQEKFSFSKIKFMIDFKTEFEYYGNWSQDMLFVYDPIDVYEYFKKLLENLIFE